MKRDIYQDVDEGEEEIQQKISPKAILHGSTPLGISIKEDIDVFIPCDSKEEAMDLIEEFREKYNLRPSDKN